MTSFRCLPIEAATVARFRHSGHDDRGNTLRTLVAAAGAAPCRQCLRNAAAGEAMLLGAYDLPAPRGIYWTPSPIFLHAQDCPRFDAADTVAPIVRGRLISVRSYDAEGMCLYDLGEVCDGDDAERPLFRALGDDRARTVNIHTAKPGCLLCAVARG